MPTSTEIPNAQSTLTAESDSNLKTFVYIPIERFLGRVATEQSHCSNSSAKKSKSSSVVRKSLYLD